MVPATREEIIHSERAQIEAGEAAAESDTRGVGEESVDAEVAADSDDGEGVNGAAVGGDELRRGDAPWSGQGAEGVVGRDGKAASVLAAGESARLGGGGEDILVGGIGEGGGKEERMEDAEAIGDGEAAKRRAVVSGESVDGALGADDGWEGGGRQLPSGEVALRAVSEARAARRSERSGRIEPGVEGRRRDGGSGGQRERLARRGWAPTTVEADAHSIDMRIVSIVGKRREQVGVVAEDAGGEAGGDGGTEDGEAGEEAGEVNRRAENGEETRRTTNEATSTNDGGFIQSNANKSGSGDRPARCGTRPAGRSTRSSGRVIGAAATEEVGSGADKRRHGMQRNRKKHEPRAVRPRGAELE